MLNRPGWVGSGLHNTFPVGRGRVVGRILSSTAPSSDGHDLFIYSCLPAPSSDVREWFLESRYNSNDNGLCLERVG